MSPGNPRDDRDDPRARDSRSDPQLVDAVNQGDVAAFESLYYRYRDWVVALAYRFTGNGDDALDVLQETFSYVLGKFPGFELRAKFTTFLYPVVKNLSATSRRKTRRFQSDDPSPEVAARRDPDHGSNPEASRAELAAVLATLPEGQREVLLLRFVDDMSLEEIALALAIPLGTVKSRLHNALGRLRGDERTRRYFLE